MTTRMPAPLKSFVLAAGFAGLLAGAGLAASPDPAAWDDTWVGGWDSGQGTQLIIVGGAVIGFFWGGDYIDIGDSSNLSAGEPLAFKWETGAAEVKSAPGGGLVLVIHEKGKPETVLPLSRD